MRFSVRKICCAAFGAESVNYRFQHIVCESDAHTLLLTAEHRENALGVGVHIDFRKYPFAFSWFITRFD